MRLPTITLILLLSFACSTNQKEKNADSQTIDSEQSSTEVEGPKAGADCEDFLDNYEKYVDEVIELYDKVKTNPMDMESTQKIMESSAKMIEWTNKWQALHECADSEEYMERMDKLEKKMDDAMEE